MLNPADATSRTSVTTYSRDSGTTANTIPALRSARSSTCEVTRLRSPTSPASLGRITELLLDSASFPWYYQPATVTTDNPDAPWLADWPDGPQLTHNLVVDGLAVSMFAQPIVDELGWGDMSWAVPPGLAISRIKANLLLPASSAPHNRPHVDLSSPHVALLLYLNDSDGDTVFFDREFGDDVAGMSVCRREAPRAGDVLIFDGARYHASTPPSSSPRCVLNFTLRLP